MFRVQRIAIGFTAITGLLIGAAAQAEKTAQYNSRIQAKNPVVAELRSIAILNFNGKDGDAFADALASALQSAQLDSRPVFEIRTLDSMNYRSPTDITRAEVANAIRQGQKLGVKLVFTGTVGTASVVRTPFTRDESVCAESVKLFKCSRMVTTKIQCEKVNGTYTVAARAIRVDNGAVIYAETVSSAGEYKVCNGQLQATSIGGAIKNIFGGKKANAPPEISTPDALLDKIRTDVAGKIRLQVAPYNRSMTVTFIDAPIGLAKADQAQFKNALAFAEIGRLDRACAMFETMYTGANQTNVPLIYNMGVCQEALTPDDPGSALSFYARADELLSKPNKLVSDAFLRAKSMVGTERSLRGK